MGMASLVPRPRHARELGTRLVLEHQEHQHALKIMAERRQQSKAIGFKSIQLLKDQTLGIGSYGKVCKAKCDDLLCAAKLIHETLFDPTAPQLIAPQREHRLPMRRFEQECEFLSTIRHPNIIQYLGIYQDPDTGLPALLMELMDDSLTHFLESSPQPIPYHIQVNICHDVIRALSFLHSNDIVHRDLSSNNVLLIGNVKAKVTDFGMARLGDQNPRATQLTFTMCPGTDVYMPPEAVQDKPEYSEKIDCFSFGVITVQILTQEFPNPGDRRKRIEIDHPGLPKGTLIEARISEIERRQNHIGKIDSDHSLLSIILDCLKDTDVERPSAQQLCERVAALKEGPQYSESVRAVEARSTAERGRSDEIERDRELRSLRQQHSQQVQGLQQIIQSQASRLEETAQILRQKDETIAAGQQQLRQLMQLERENNQALSTLEEQLGCVKLGCVKLGCVKLTWREGKKAPCGMRYCHCAAVDGGILYVRVSEKMYIYKLKSSSWSPIQNSPTKVCSLVIINHLLTLVGGQLHSTLTNQLFSLTGEGSGRRWTEEFPPMPTKRQTPVALCTGTVLIVAGGCNKDLKSLQAVEVLTIRTLQWSTAVDLPHPVGEVPSALCDGQIYILGEPYVHMNTMTCSVTALIQSCELGIRKKDTGVWMTVTEPPVNYTTCVCFHGRLLTIGGEDSDGEPTTAVHMYNLTTNSWEVISHMEIPRQSCIAVVLPNNQLMVVGGYTVGGVRVSNSVELAIVE